MSYNPTPDWAHVRLDPNLTVLSCPNCGALLYPAIAKAFGRAQTAGNYHPAHIPPELVFDCPGCEIDVEVPIQVTVYASGPPQESS